MSGIYIPGMKMPKDGCKSCAFDIYGSCLIRVNLDKPWEVTHSCPLIELPPHGRLIDADELSECDLFDLFWQEYGYSHTIIDDAPTILPADGGDAQ